MTANGRVQISARTDFAQLVLADEINRASPSPERPARAMEEHQVDLGRPVDGAARPFFVIATQNPQDQVALFPCPIELDRFLMRCIWDTRGRRGARTLAASIGAIW